MSTPATETHFNEERRTATRRTMVQYAAALGFAAVSGIGMQVTMNMTGPPERTISTEPVVIMMPPNPQTSEVPVITGMPTGTSPAHR